MSTVFLVLLLATTHALVPGSVGALRISRTAASRVVCVRAVEPHHPQRRISSLIPALLPLLLLPAAAAAEIGTDDKRVFYTAIYTGGDPVQVLSSSLPHTYVQEHPKNSPQHAHTNTAHENSLPHILSRSLALSLGRFHALSFSCSRTLTHSTQTHTHSRASPYNCAISVVLGR